MKAFCLGLLLVNFINVLAQEPVWHEGALVLRKKEVLKGELAIERELILLRYNGQVNVYPAHKVDAVYFHDTKANINRRFASFGSGRGSQSHLYEIVLQGQVSVLRRPRNGTTGHSEAEDYHYFVRHDERITRLNDFRRKVYPLLLRSAGRILSIYISDHHLDPNRRADAIRVIEFYNHVVTLHPAMAKH